MTFAHTSECTSCCYLATLVVGRLIDDDAPSNNQGGVDLFFVVKMILVLVANGWLL